MRVIKKYTAFLTACVLCLTFLPVFPAVAVAEDDTVQIIEKLAAFGIVTEEELVLLESNEPMTRGDFIRLAVRLAAADPATLVPAQYVPPFQDVAASDKNYPFLCAAYITGLADGTQTGMFHPDEPVTRNMAAKLLVTVLGYKPAAEIGGYPSGYQSIANQLKLFSGCGNDENVTGYMAARMLENALEAPMMKETEIGDNYKFDISKNNIYRQERFEIYRTEGILDGTNMTTLLTSDSSVRNGDITIDGEKYAAGDCDAAKYLGYYVEAYYSGEPGEEHTLLYLTQKESKNRVIQLDVQDISDVNAQQITYADEAGKWRTVKLSQLASLIYNGKQTSFSEKLFEAECGKLTLIDNNRDGSYDVLLLNAYRTIVVSNISAAAHTVTDYLGGESVELDPTSSEYYLIMTNNGQPISFENLAEWDVLSYAESIDDGKHVKTVLVSKQRVVGSVSALNASDKRATIEGKEYECSPSMMEALNLDAEGTFYIDVFERVVAANSERDIVYGFVKAGAKRSFDTYILKIFTENNRWVELPLRSKLRLNGEPGRKAEEAFGLLTENGKILPQLVTYRVSVEREVNELNTARDVTVGSAEEEIAIRDGVFRKSLSFGSVVYRNMSNSRSFEDYACLKDAKIFFIPPQPANAADDQFSVGGVGLLTHDQSYTNVNIYDMDELMCAKACTVDKKTEPISNSLGFKPFMLVTDISEAINDDDEIVDALQGLYNGGMSTVYMENKTLVESKGVRKGDIVQFAVNSDGEAEDILMQFKAEDGFTQKGIEGGAYNTATILRGQVVKANTAEREIVIDYGLRKGVFPLTRNAKIYIYDPVRNRGTVGTESDIAQGDYIFYAARYFDINTIIIFKEY